ncbi:hypothetical protein NCC49_006012 [Naganishia albida]|nr:hypothetical protein NCC49_006012 [Naganishia albida]
MDVHQKEDQATSDAGSPLPLDIIGLIGQDLASNNWNGSLAALNATSAVVYQQTLPSLYQICIAWASRVHIVFPPLWSKEVGEWVNMKQGEKRNEREDVRDGWERMIRLRGADYIEFLGVPFCALDQTQSQTILLRLLGVLPSDTLPRLKATISIADEPKVHDEYLNNWLNFRPDLILNIGHSYRSGTADFLRLGQALQLFVEDDAQRGPGVLVQDYRLVVNVSAGSSRAASIQDLEANLANVRFARSMVPHDVCIKTLGLSLSTNTLDGVFLDIALLMAGAGEEERGDSGGSEHAPPRRRMDVHVTSMVELVACAKAFRRGVKAYPPVAALSLRFALPNGITTLSLGDDMDQVLPIFRAGYLSTRERFPAWNWGGVSLTIPTQSAASCFTWTCQTDGEDGIVHQLVCRSYGYGQSTWLHTDLLATVPAKPSKEERLEALKWKQPTPCSPSDFSIG